MTDASVKLDASIEFAGKTFLYNNIEFKIISKTEKSVQLKGILKIQLNDFEVERPSLVGFSVENEVPITIDTTWEKN